MSACRSSAAAVAALGAIKWGSRRGAAAGPSARARGCCSCGADRGIRTTGGTRDAGAVSGGHAVLGTTGDDQAGREDE